VKISYNFFSQSGTFSLRCCRWHKFTTERIFLQHSILWHVTQHHHTQNALLCFHCEMATRTRHRVIYVSYIALKSVGKFQVWKKSGKYQALYVKTQTLLCYVSNSSRNEERNSQIDVVEIIRVHLRGNLRPMNLNNDYFTEFVPHV